MNKIVWVYMRRGLKNLKVIIISRKTIHASQHCDHGYFGYPQRINGTNLVTVLDFTPMLELSCT